MICKSCGNPIPSSQAVCRVCGAAAEVDPRQGERMFTLSFHLIGLLPLVCVFLEFILAGISGVLHVGIVLDLLTVTLLLTLFGLAFQGSQWAARAIGWFLLGGSLIMVLACGIFLVNSPNADFRVILGLVYMAYGGEMLRSKDIPAFISRRAAQGTEASVPDLQK
jgi:predicted nucleic acid-binding Zn ribbon protein